MKRRKALIKIGLGVSATLTLPAFLNACKEDPSPAITYKGVVGIIGAGAAGLCAADILRSQGIQVRIFEASDRLGGRVRTFTKFLQPTNSLIFDPNNLPNSNFPTELGAQFVIGSDSAWGKIINELNVQVVDFPSLSEDSYILDGFIKSESELAVDPDFIAAKNFYDNLSSQTATNTSVQQAVVNEGINSRVHSIINSWIGNKAGTSNDSLGVKPLAEGLGFLTRNTNQSILKSNPMEDALLSRYSNVVSLVELNTVVKNINHAGEKIILSGERKTAGSIENFSEEVDKVIVTVPVSVLKTGMIAFAPALPASKMASLSRMEMDASIRVRLEFKINFWGLNSGFIYGGLTTPQYFNAGIGKDNLMKTLDVTIQGPKALELSALGKDMVGVILQELDAVFAGKASQNIRRDVNDNILAVIMDWTKEEFIQGGVAYIKPGGSNADRIILGEAIGEKLFFAGEATDGVGEAGTISGAILSAERAAQEVMDSIVIV